MRNVTGPKFFGFVGKDAALLLPRVGFASREDPRRVVAADLAGLLACCPASHHAHGWKG